MRLTSNRPCSTKPNYANGSDHKRVRMMPTVTQATPMTRGMKTTVAAARAVRMTPTATLAAPMTRGMKTTHAAARGVRMMPTVALAVAAPPITRGGMKTK